ncbi:hypothetical protein DAPPUDRAFT_253850 [Daphnia pulex]|uniref:Transposable element P transposase-like RNase H domain-containing protein n=1 Tax=Daphnia pulex TaxID=6669 RepID=E9H5K9_DAPPU|nr:hypothetical protein DAPPUDRAFT_253850 [Daphnia pulex]|eukprot:EFX72977.1 hypothetical protein DAPPUDRAFT_253850 [Daphnia pulex]
MEAAEPVALPCVTTEDMFQEPTTETLLHIPPEKELQSQSESQLRVEFEPNDIEAAEPVALPCVTTEDMFQEPTSDTLLHIPPEKELQSESESQLRVEFEPNDIEAAEPVALPCVTTEDMFQEPTTETLLHIPPEKEMASESESQLRVEFEPNDMEVDELIGAPGEMTEEMLQENSEQTARETEIEGYLDPATYTDVIARVKLPSSSWMWQEDKLVSGIVSNLEKEKQTLTITNQKLIKEQKKNNFDEKLKCLSPTEQLIVKTMMDKAKAKPGKDNCKKGMRYDPLFLMHCLQIRLKSSKTYRHLKANGILPLPSLESIRKLLSSTDCRFGLNELALQHLKEALEGLPEQDRYGSLIWDEIHIKKKLHFDSRKFEFDGLTDFGDETEEIDVAPGLADHVLVFMFRPYKQSWVQTIACYATRGATPGHIISNLVTKITTVLFNHSAIIQSLISITMS